MLQSSSRKQFNLSNKRHESLTWVVLKLFKGGHEMSREVIEEVQMDRAENLQDWHNIFTDDLRKRFEISA